MERRFTLSLPEAVLLIAIDEPSGAVRGGAELRYGLAGAMLIELALCGRVAYQGRDLAVVDRGRTGDPLLDQGLSVMRRSSAARPVRSWLLRITRAIHDLQQRYLDRLVQDGMVLHVQARALGLFATHHYPLLTTELRHELIERLRQIALAGASAEPREIVLLRLLDACALTDALYPRAEARLARSRLVTHGAAERLSLSIVVEVASLRHDSADFVYIVGVG